MDLMDCDHGIPQVFGPTCLGCHVYRLNPCSPRKKKGSFLFIYKKAHNPKSKKDPNTHLVEALEALKDLSAQSPLARDTSCTDFTHENEKNTQTLPSRFRL